MTIISALRCDGKTVFGFNDGAILAGTPIVGTSNPWIRFGEWALGITGESSIQRILESELNGETQELTHPLEVVEFISRSLIENFVGNKDSGEFVTTFGLYGILLNSNGNIWDLSGCLSLTEIPPGLLWAQGSGAEYAIGADFALRQSNDVLSPERRVSICVNAAIANDIHSAGSAVIEFL